MKYAIEEKYYSIETNSFGLTTEILYSLMTKRIVDITENKFKFTYVGLISIDDLLLFVAPKLYKENNVDIHIVKRTIKVLKKSAKRIDDISSFFIPDKKFQPKFGELAVADFLINDYMELGEYKKYFTVLEQSSYAQNNWKHTIENIIPYFSEKIPFYNNSYSDIVVEDINSPIVILYNMVLSHLIDKYALVLGYNIAPNSYYLHEYKKAFSRNQYDDYINIIEQELQETYIDREVQILKALKYFLCRNDWYNNKSISLYGTTRFDIVWEECFKTVFSDEFDVYMSCMPIPVWKANGGHEVRNSHNIMKTDIVHKHIDTLLILDAKYYEIKLNANSITDNPDSYDIVKQYVYQLSFENNKIADNYINALIFPINDVCESDYHIFGTVVLPLFNKKPILCVFYSMNNIFQRYINGDNYSAQEFDKFILQCNNYYLKS